MIYEAPFGCIYILDKEGKDRLVNLDSIDIDYVKDQCGINRKACHIRTDDGFCQSSWTAGESASSIMGKISKHDHMHEYAVRSFAERNNIVLMEGKLW